MEALGHTISTDNYNRKPTPLWLKIMADCLLGSIAIVGGLILTLPEFPGREWVIFGWSAFASLFKLISKTIADAKAEYFSNIKP